MAEWFATNQPLITLTTTPTLTMPPRNVLYVHDDKKPFTGYKQMTLVPRQGRLLFRGSRDVYGLEEKARCLDGSLQRYTHLSPSYACTCGFYALKNRCVKISARPTFLVRTSTRCEISGQAIATVELFGRVIEATQGYRAEWQRVLSVEYFRRCWGCAKEAVGFSCGDKVVATCIDHAPFGIVNIEQIAAAVGCPVTWTDI